MAQGASFGQSQDLVVVHLYSETTRLAADALSCEREQRTETLAAHPLQARPVRVEERVPREATDVVEAPVRAPVLDQGGTGSLANAPGGLSAPGAILAGPVARPVAAGALLILVPEALNQLRGLYVRGTR